MPPRGTKRVVSQTTVDDENDENIPPQARRSGRTKNRKSASKEDLEQEEDQEDVDSDSAGEEEDRDENSSEEDEEIRKPRKRAKKTPPPQSRRKSSGAKTNRIEKRPKTRKPKNRRSGPEDVPENPNECPMLDALLDEKVALDPTVLEWIERYEEDETAAMTEMVNFILRCCGCPFEISSEDVDVEDNIVDNLAEIQEAYKQTNPREYPLIATKKTLYRKFPKRLQEFFRRLLQKFSAKGMLSADPSVLDKIQRWVFSLSSTTFRPFRHTATAISLGFITTLCEIYAKLNKAHDTSNAALEKEKKSKKSARIKELERAAEEQENQLQTLTELMQSTYDRFGSLVKWTECVHELGQWMQKLPQVYFDTAHLRYIGWAVSDSNAATRLDALKTLQKLYESEEYISNLRLFTESFENRFVEMATVDADRSVRVATIVLLDTIRQRDLMEPEAIDKVSLMIFDPESRIRKSVVNLFLSNVEAVYEETLEGIGGSVERVETELGDDKESPDGIPYSWLKYNALVKVLSKYDKQVDELEKAEEVDEGKNIPLKGFEFGEVESRIAMASSAIVGEMEELHDWDNLATYLLRDHSSQLNGRPKKTSNILAKARRACSLNSSEEVILLEVLNTAIRVRRDHEDESDLSKGKKRKRSASEQPVQEDDVDVSTGLVLKLPQLIRRFGSKPETAAQILRMVQYVKLEKYDELRQLDALEALLEDVGKQFMNHTDANVFKEASASLLHAQKFESLGHVTEPKVIELQDEVNMTFLGTVNGKDLVTAGFTDQEIADLTTATARLENLLSVTDCTVSVGDDNTKQGKSSFDLLTNLLERAITLHDIEEVEMISHALKAIRWFFMWRIRAITNLEAEFGIDEDALNALRKKREHVVNLLTRILQDRPADEVRVQATTLLIDLYTLITTIDESTRTEHLTPEDYKIPPLIQASILNILDEEIHLLHQSEKKPIVRGSNADDEDEEDEEIPDDAGLSPETRSAIHEKRACDVAARITLAILGGALERGVAERLVKVKGKVGQSFDKIILELGTVAEKEKEKAKKAVVVSEAIVVEDGIEDPIEEGMEEVREEVGSEMEA